MNLKDIRFTLYDVVSYTFCGAIVFGLLYASIRFNAISLPDTELSKLFSELISVESIIPFVLAAYLLGKIISAISSILVEKILLGWIFRKSYKPDKIDNYIDAELYSYFNEKFSKTYNNITYSENKWRLITTFVEENRPASYATAFVFLSYYGMARNLMLIFLIFSILLLNSDLLLSFLAFLIFLVEMYEYSRFTKHFHKRMIYAFLNIKEGE